MSYVEDQASSYNGFRLVNRDGNNNTRGIRFSRRGDRAVLLLNVNAQRGVPVFDLTTADTAFYVDQLRGATAAAFSTDGSVLYLVSNACCQRGDVTLVAVDASDGRVLATLTVPDTGSGAPVERGLAIDPSLPYVYLSVGPRGNFTILVLDAGTLEPVGTLAVPDAFRECGSATE
jgi:DNA-binding beta-propeller fold protein YncE